MDASQLLTFFSRALSHELRTPLSVISNELSYIGTLVPPEEIERAQGKVQQISQLLKEAVLERGASESVEIGSYLSEMLLAAPTEFELEIKSELHWNSFSSPELRYIFTALFEYFDNSSDLRALLDKEVLSFRLPKQDEEDGVEHFDSFCALYIQRLGLTRLRPVKLDALFLSAGIKVDIVYSSDSGLSEIRLSNESLAKQNLSDEG